MSDNKTASSGIGFIGMLTVVFIALKLSGAINWSWLWVLSPIWISWLLLILVAVIAIFAALVRNRRDR